MQVSFLLQCWGTAQCPWAANVKPWKAFILGYVCLEVPVNHLGGGSRLGTAALQQCSPLVPFPEDLTETCWVARASSPTPVLQGRVLG